MSVRQEKRKRGDGSSYLQWTADCFYRKLDGTELRARRDPRINTQRAAEKLEREILTTMENGTWELAKKPPAPTLAEFQERFIEKYAERNNKPSVVAEKKMVFRLHLLPLLGSMRLDAITDEVIEQWKTEQTGEPKTVNNRLAVLSRVLHVAEEWKLIAKAPTIRTVEQPDPDFDFLDFDEAKALVANCDRPRLRMAVVSVLNAGYRNGEFRVLQWPDLDIERGVSTVRRNDWRGSIGTPKHGRTRHVPINAGYREALKEWQHRRSLWVFDGAEVGGYMSEREEITPLLSAAKRAGLGRRVTWHTLRHTFASHLVMRGASLYAVSQLLGHRDVKVTQRYAHLAPAHAAQAVALLDCQNSVNEQLATPEVLGI